MRFSLLLAILFSTACFSAVEAGISVRAYGTTSSWAALQDADSDYGDVGARYPTSPLSASIDIGSDSHFHYTLTSPATHADAYADSEVTVQIGAIHAYADARGTAINSAVNATAYAYGLWEDEIRIVSDTLANGTPVTLQATLVLDRTVPTGAFNGSNGNATWSFIVTSPMFYQAFGNSSSFTDSWDRRDTRTTFVQNFNTSVGATVYMWQSLGMNTGIYYAPGSGEMKLDASNTVKMGLTSLTPGASFRSAGGATYTLSATVPEPASIIGWALVIGCVALAAVKRRLSESRLCGSSAV